MRSSFIALLTLVTATPAVAQEWQVARERFRFVGTSLTVEVAAAVPGRLSIIRGEAGMVRVAGRSLDGFAAFGLADRGRLTLSAAGAGAVDYMVSVPEGVWVSVRLPDRHALEAIGSYGAPRSFEWTAAPSQAAAADPRTGSYPYDQPSLPGLQTTYGDVQAPRSVSLPDLSLVHSVTVRVEGDRFRVATSRPLALEPGSRDFLEIRPAGRPLDIAIVVPDGTRDFTLLARGTPALTITNGTIATLCTPLTQQWLSEGRRWFTFNPVDGRLQCEATADIRRKG